MILLKNRLIFTCHSVDVSADRWKLRTITKGLPGQVRAEIQVAPWPSVRRRIVLREGVTKLANVASTLFSNRFIV